MKIYTLVFLIFISGFYEAKAQNNSKVPQETQKNKKSKTKQLKLVWSDEFNYLGLPDSTKWSYDVGGDGWGNNELQYYTRASQKNAIVGNGVLSIIALKENFENRNYTSARLLTKGKADWSYGRVEIKAKLPKGRGSWPAGWMLGANIDTVGWPQCGEIDIMEHVGYDPDTIVGSIHTDTYNHVKHTQKTKRIFIKNPATEFHLYACEWTTNKMVFFLDGKPYFTVKNEHKTDKEWPFDKPQFMLLNIAIGGNWGGQKGVDESIFPVKMEVDYVRVFQ